MCCINHIQSTEQCYQSILSGRRTQSAELLEMTRETLRAFLQPVKVGLFSEPWGHERWSTLTVAIYPVFDKYKQNHCTSLSAILQQPCKIYQHRFSWYVWFEVNISPWRNKIGRACGDTSVAGTISVRPTTSLLKYCICNKVSHIENFVKKKYLQAHHLHA